MLGIFRDAVLSHAAPRWEVQRGSSFGCHVKSLYCAVLWEGEVLVFKTSEIRKRDWVLLMILVVGGLARYWGIGFGLPHTECRPDETTILRIALKFGTGDLNPHFFRYPTLYMYILFCLYICYFLFGMSTGKYASMSDFIAEYSLNPSNLYLIGRVFSAFLGTASVFVLYKIAKHLFGEKTAAVSSLFLTLAYLHVRDSHFGVTDVALTFLIMCSILFIVRSHEDKTPRSYVYAGVFAGLATSTKYSAILLLVPMCIAHVYNVLDEGDREVGSFVDKRILGFVAVLALAFLLGTPFALLDFHTFISDFLFEVEHLSRGHLINLGRGWSYHLRFSLPLGLGWSLFSASLLGILVLIRGDRRKAMVLCSFPVVYYATIGKGYTVFLRYMIPLVPFLCVTGAVFTVAIGDRLARYLKPHLRNVTTLVVVALTILPSACNAIHFDRLLGQKDNRLIATEWVNENIEAGSSIYQSGSWAGKLQLYPTLESLERAYEADTLEGGKGRVLEAKIDFLRSGAANGYDEWTYYDESGSFEFDDEVQDALPRYIITEESPLVVYGTTPEGIARLLITSYCLAKSFEVIDIGNEANLFDQQDTFYVPFAGFRDVRRPGPNICIYERR